MRTAIFGLLGLALLAWLANALLNTGSEETPLTTAVIEEDHLWLEEVEGDRALDWVRSQNARSLDVLQADPRFEAMQAAALEIVNADDRIPYGVIRDGQVYNFWQDETNVRGLWRRTSLESYATEDPEWETVLDFDALAEAEDKNWVFKGSNCLDIKGQPVTKCFVALSDGGKDAVINREFHLATKSFVEDGFITPEAKQGVSWVDEDTVLVATDWGGDGATLTESGYPSIVKRWTRGTPLESAETLVTGDKTDVGVWPFVLELEDGRRLPGAVESDTFFTSTYFLIGEGDALRQLPIPPMASPSAIYQGQLLVALREDWTPEGNPISYESGDLVGFDFDEWLTTDAPPLVDMVFRPGPRQSFEGVSKSGDTALISINDNVVGQVLRLERVEDGWTFEPLQLPGAGQASLAFASSRTSTAFFNYEDFLTPASLLSYNAETGEMTPLKSVPGKFDATSLKVQQFESTSSDGTKIPYFIIHRADIPFDSNTPTLLYGYGGFQISLNPAYAPVTGKLWLEEGGAYVIANIRGGGEFGPDWHQAGLKTKRQIVYDDFISVAENLIERGITRPERLGIMGGSNGGLLMGVMLNQRPDLWRAVVVQVPLLDMMRYHLLLAGASWVDEYGSPDDPEERAFLETISPYQNFSSETEYPAPFFVTSTKDDRVHPGHARKMAKLFQESGKPFLYYENIDGGHSAAANQVERAKRVALEYTYLFQQLVDGVENNGSYVAESD